MPGMNGLDLGRLLRARLSGVPVIMITARSDLGVEIDAQASGAIGLLRKPFEKDALIGCLEKALKACSQLADTSAKIRHGQGRTGLPGPDPCLIASTRQCGIACGHCLQ